MTNVTDPSMLVPDRFRQRLIDERRQQANACEKCKRSRSEQYCVECRVHLCGPCLQELHRASSFSNDHRVMSSDEQREQEMSDLTRDE